MPHLVIFFLKTTWCALFGVSVLQTETIYVCNISDMLQGMLGLTYFSLKVPRSFSVGFLQQFQCFLQHQRQLIIRTSNIHTCFISIPASVQWRNQTSCRPCTGGPYSAGRSHEGGPVCNSQWPTKTTRMDRRETCTGEGDKWYNNKVMMCNFISTDMIIWLLDCTIFRAITQQELMNNNNINVDDNMVELITQYLCRYYIIIHYQSYYTKAAK